MKETFHKNLPVWISAGKLMAVASKQLRQDCYMGTQR